jgi:hypothetical protein
LRHMPWFPTIDRRLICVVITHRGWSLEDGTAMQRDDLPLDMTWSCKVAAPSEVGHLDVAKIKNGRKKILCEEFNEPNELRAAVSRDGT